MPAITKPNQHFDANTYTGNSGTKDVTVGFDPGLVWYKNRGRASTYHYMFDTVRGANKALYSNLTDVEDNNFPSYNTQSFISNGSRIVQNNGGADHLNYSNDTYILWAWKAGSTVTNTSGTISSQVSVNSTAGFSVVTFTHTSGNQTVGHGLGVAPSMIILKNRSNTSQWPVYHSSLSSPATSYLLLNTTAAVASASPFWGASGVNSTTFGISDNVCQPSSTFVAYCWTPIAGYSAFGSYTGNGSTDGPFIYTGFRPRYILVKKSSGTSNWQVLDSSRSQYNLAGEDLLPNDSSAEKTIGDGYNQVDFLSNGFKIRNTNCNDSGGTYIYACFAEAPFKYASAR
jgi:hypothetical protein